MHVADHAALDAGKSANNQLFWEGMQEALQGQDEVHDNLHFANDEVLSERHPKMRRPAADPDFL